MKGHVLICTGVADYSTTRGECCFEANQKETMCTIQLVVDSVAEGNEVLRIELAPKTSQCVCEAPGTTTDITITETGEYGTLHTARCTVCKYIRTVSVYMYEPTFLTYVRTLSVYVNTCAYISMYVSAFLTYVHACTLIIYKPKGMYVCT